MPSRFFPLGGRSRTIQFWLGWLVVICIVPPLLVSAYLVTFAYTKARAGAENDIVDTARALRQAVDATLHGVQSSLQVLAASPSLRSDDLPAFDEMAREVLQGLPGNVIALIDATGQQRVSTMVPFGQPLPRTGVPDLIRAVFNSGRPAVSGFFIGATSKLPQVGVGVPVFRDGKVVYALVLGLNPAGLAEILQRQKIPEDWTVAILDSGGTIVARTRSPEQFTGKKGTPEFQRQTSEASEGVYQTPTLDGVSVTGGFSRSPVTGWMIAIGVPETVITADARRALVVNIATGLILLSMGALFAKNLSRRIGHSIRMMTGPALALGSSSKVDVPTVDIQEVNEIGRALRRASQLIEQRERERDEAECKREQAESRLRQSQIFGAIGETAGGLAHDFGNLLTPIVYGLDQIRKHPDHPRSKRLIEVARAAADRAAILVRNLKTVASQQPLAIKTTDVNEAIDAMKGILGQALGCSARLIVEPGPGIWPVQADMSQFERAMLNLVANARDAMAAPGAVRISTANVGLHGEVDGLEGDYVAIAVSDTGSGMPPEILSHAFEPLFTTKAPGVGSGLGLASIYRFAKQCAGGTTIESEVGKGTTVTIYLPRDAQAKTIGGL